MDLVGRKFGHLVVLKLDEQKSTSHCKYWICECDCGKKISVQGGHLKSGNTSSCKCHQNEFVIEHNKTRRKQIPEGTVFSNWTVIRHDETSKRNKYICRCSCGTIKSVRLDGLESGASQSCGCVKSRGEEKLANILTEMNINFEREKTFDGCIGNGNYRLRFDFYLPDYNTCIEFDGIQHYSPAFGWCNESRISIAFTYDKIKNQFCINSNIKLIRIPYFDFDILNNEYISQHILFDSTNVV